VEDLDCKYSNLDSNSTVSKIWRQQMSIEIRVGKLSSIVCHYFKITLFFKVSVFF